MSSNADTTPPTDPEKQLNAAAGVERDVWEALRTVEDPELPVSIVDLGLIYGVTVRDRVAVIELTLTYSGCPGRDMIVGDAERAVQRVDGIDAVEIKIVYSPPWSVDRITDRGRDALNEFGLAVPGDETSADPDCHR